MEGERQRLLRFQRVDVVIGSILTGVIGLAIAVACAATLHRTVFDFSPHPSPSNPSPY